MFNEKFNKKFLEPKYQKMYDTLLMSDGDLNTCKYSKNTAMNQIYFKLEKKVKEICNNSPGIFTLLKKRAESSQEIDSETENIYEDSLKSLSADIGYDKSIGEISEENLAILFNPMPKEVRERFYIQRDKITVAELLKVALKWQERSHFAFHVSPNKITNGIIKGPVNFSTDIKQLFNKSGEGEHVYAFRLPPDFKGVVWNNNTTCFGELGGNVYFEDQYSLVDEQKKDPFYRQKALQAIGASFKDDYYADTDRARAFMDD